MSPFIYTLIMTHITIAAVTIFLHRSQAHRSVTLHPIISHFFRFWLWLTTGMETKQWVAIHRKHHAKCETEEDPHSPVFQGVWNIMFLGIFFYKKECKNEQTMIEYGQGTPDDWLERNIYQKYSAKGILLMLAINVYLFGPTGILCWLVQMAWIPFWAAGFVNGIGHYFGYRTFASKDTSSNISPLVLPLGIIIGGEEFHNNHHAFPRSAKLSYKWYEFDIGWLYIRLMEMLNLAKVNHRTAKPEGSKAVFAFGDSVSFFASKMRSIRAFDKKVTSINLKEKYQDVKNAAGISYKKALKILSTHKEALNEQEMEKAQKIISSNETMTKINDLKIKFEEIWQGVGVSVNERIENIKKWCNEAEASGVKSITNFTSYIKKKMGIVAS